MTDDNTNHSINDTSVRIRQLAQEWCDNDPNETTTLYVATLLQESTSGSSKADRAQQELAALFPDDANQRISFGTSGLRAAMKPGPLGMNDLIVVQTAQGLARYCLSLSIHQQSPRRTVVIGYDHRCNSALQLSSLSFALLTSLVFRQAGYDDVVLLDGCVPTPLVPYVMFDTEATVGIMVTASHNPKQDAGYKVYWHDGCQIRSPIDKEIAAAILDNLEPWTDYRRILNERRTQYPNDPCLGLSEPRERTEDSIDSYLQAIASSGLVTRQSSKWTLALPPPRYCYTAMHGVGYRLAPRIFSLFGISDWCSVPSQQAPHPDFPTVVFPNPEEKGTLDASKAFAEDKKCQILLANDPDADRLAVAEFDASNNEWTVFTGDQLGTMLGHWLWQQLKDMPNTTDGGGDDDDSYSLRPISMVASTASSKMLAEIARVEGFACYDTLTGFKWIGSKAQELEESGNYRNLFCYEESIGFCCGNVVFDKDGLSAMGVFCELCLAVYNRGMTMSQHMQSLYDKYGEFVCNNGYYILEDPKVVVTILEKIMGAGWDLLSAVDRYIIESVVYLGEPGYDSRQDDLQPLLPTSKTSPMLILRFTNGCVAQFRGSGTEPKLKYYIELKGAPGVPRQEVSQELEIMSRVFLEELLEPSKYGLITPLL